MKKIAQLMHDLAACVHLRAVADKQGVVTRAAIKRAYNNSKSASSRITRLIELELIENIGRNRYRLID